jgi:hypothetical protein
MQASQDWKKRYAAMSAIGTLAEGSVKQFKSDIDAIMQLVHTSSEIMLVLEKKTKLNCGTLDSFFLCSPTRIRD